MGRTPQKSVKDTASYLADLFESIIGEVTEDIKTVDTGDIEIDDTTPSTMLDSIITWRDIHGEEEVSVVYKPNIGSVFFDKTITDKEKW